MPDESTHITPELQRLILLMEGTAHLIVKHPCLDKDAAIEFKKKMNLPIGVLNSRFGLQTANGNKKA